jgi:hypothetical protein
MEAVRPSRQSRAICMWRRRAQHMGQARGVGALRPTVSRQVLSFVAGNGQAGGPSGSCLAVRHCYGFARGGCRIQRETVRR